MTHKPEEVEAVARAICNADWITTWADAPEDPKGVYRDLARAALAALSGLSPREEAGEMAAFGASDAACVLYPEEQQSALRQAFCNGAAHAIASPSPHRLVGWNCGSLDHQVFHVFRTKAEAEEHHKGTKAICHDWYCVEPLYTAAPSPPKEAVQDDPSELVKDLRETAQAFNSTAWGRRDGGQEWSIASIKLDNAADRIEELETALRPKEAAQDMVSVPRDLNHAQASKLAQAWGYTIEETCEVYGLVIDALAASPAVDVSRVDFDGRPTDFAKADALIVPREVSDGADEQQK